MTKRRSNLAVALVLIAAGTWFLSIELFPIVKTFAYGSDTWPVQIVLAGAFLGLVGVITWMPALMSPACLVAGIGGLLFWQNLTGRWETWAYAWALIPGFIGLGMLLTGLLNRQRSMLAGAVWTVVTSLALFAVFGSFLGGLELVSQYWPVLFIAMGVLMLAKGVKRRGS